MNKNIKPLLECADYVFSMFLRVWRSDYRHQFLYIIDIPFSELKHNYVLFIKNTAESMDDGGRTVATNDSDLFVTTLLSLHYLSTRAWGIAISLLAGLCVYIVCLVLITLPQSPPRSRFLWQNVFHLFVLQMSWFIRTFIFLCWLPTMDFLEDAVASYPPSPDVQFRK